MLFSPVHVHWANIYFGILAALGMWQEQSRGQPEPLALIFDTREVWVVEGRHRGAPSHCSCRWCKSWGVTASVQPLSVLSLLLALNTEHLQPWSIKGKQVSFLQQTFTWKGNFQPAEGPSLTVGPVICVLCSGSCPLGPVKALKRWTSPLYLHCWKTAVCNKITS